MGIDDVDVPNSTQWNIIQPQKENLPICNNMDRPWGLHAKLNKSDKEKYCVISPIYEIFESWKKGMLY